MNTVRRQTLAETTARHIQEGMNAGRWVQKLPGVERLSAECGVSRKTLRTALRLLEAEGLLQPGGNGRSRTATGSPEGISNRPVRIGILLRDRLAHEDSDQQVLFHDLQHALQSAGFECFFANKSQNDFHDSLPRIQKELAASRADGWVVVSGTRELLVWGLTSRVPFMAIGGHSRDLPIASTGADSAPAYAEAVDHLMALGHRRIVLLTPHQFRVPVELNFVKKYKAHLALRGIEPTPYHVPEWQETPEGLENLLASLFKVTPPTAILTLKAKWAIGALAFFARRNLHVPEDISLVSRSCDSEIAWHLPPLAHFASNQDLMVRRIVQWAASVSAGKPDRKAVPIPVTFLPAGSTGPAKGTTLHRPPGAIPQDAAGLLHRSPEESFSI